MKATGLKAAFVLLVALIMTGQAMAGWDGGRRGRGWYGPGRERGVEDDTGDQGPWMRREPGRGGPDSEAWQGGSPSRGPKPLWRRTSGRGRGGPQAFGPRGGGRRMSRGWGRGYGRPGDPGACQSFQGRGFGPRGRGWGPGAGMMRRRARRGHWEHCFRGGRGGDFRRGAGVPGRGGWYEPGRGLQGRNFGPRGRGFGQGPMMQRGPWGGQEGRGPRREGFGRSFRGRDFQGPGCGFQGRGFRPWRQRPRENGRGQGFGPGVRGRGFHRDEAWAPEGQEQGIDRPNREERPSPGPREGRGRGDRPGARRSQDRPVEHPEEKGEDIEVPVETDKPKEDPPAGEDV